MEGSSDGCSPVTLIRFILDGYELVTVSSRSGNLWHPHGSFCSSLLGLWRPCEILNNVGNCSAAGSLRGAILVSKLVS
jgi:hypothetical protein